jgi:hypothetical protein
MIEISLAPPLNLRNILFQNESIKNRNLKHKYGATKTQFPKKSRWGMILHRKRPIPPKDINSQA